MTLPLRAGASPFHCKGTLWINLQDFMRDHVPGGMAVATRLPKVPLRLFDFGHADGAMAGPGHYSGKIGGFPSLLGPWLAPTVEGYAGMALELGGARGFALPCAEGEGEGRGAFRCTFEPMVQDGEKSGIETVTLGFHLLWSGG